MFSLKSAVLAGLVASVSAVISDFQVDTLSTSAGQTLTATFTTASYISNWDDFGVIFGLQPVAEQFAGTIGKRLGWGETFNSGLSTKIGTFNMYITIPTETTSGEYELWAAVPYLVGASGQLGIKYLNQTITVA